MPNKILITGSGGFIFSNLVRKISFEKPDYSIVSVDRLSSPRTLHNIYSNKGHSFYMSDITDKHIMDNIFNVEKPNIVIHGASQYGDDSFGINTMITKTLIDCSIKYNVDKFIYMSKDSVYGQLNDNDTTFTEDSKIKANSFYATSKIASELLVQMAGRTYGFNYNIIRSCNNYGPRQSGDKLVASIIKSIQNKSAIIIHGDGKKSREWIHVDDTCYAIIKLLESDKNNEVYNLSTGAEISNLEMAHSVCEILNKGHELISFVKDKEVNDTRRSSDSSKIRKALGWEHKFKFKQGLEHTCDWYVKNSWFLK